MGLRDLLIRLAYADAELRPHVLPLILGSESPLRIAVRRLASSDPELRPHLVPLVRMADEEGESGKGKGKVSGKFIQFLEEEGDKRVTNPDTGRNVKIKSLRGPKGKELANDLFHKWLDSKKEKTPAKGKKKDEPEEAPKKKDEQPTKTPSKKDAPKEKEGPKEKKDEDDSKSESAKTPSKKKDEPKEKEAPKKDESKSETPKKDESGKAFPTPSLKKDRYKGTLKSTLYIDLKVKAKRAPGAKGKAFLEAMSKAKAKVDEKSLADMMGAPILVASGEKHSLEISNNEQGIRVSLGGPNIVRMDRIFGADDDGPYIYNDTLVLDKDAPKGLGTKIFATQVSQARAAGIKKIKCSAFRNPDDPTWVGYKVWPKLGYDGKIPEHVAAELPEAMQEKIKAAGFKKPVMVSHLYQVEGGSDWWDKNGDTFDAAFDLSDGSTSMQVLQAYLLEKAKKSDSSPEEWMSKLAAKKDKDKKPKKGKEGHENIDLDDQDNEILDAVWKNLRKKD